MYFTRFLFLPLIGVLGQETSPNLPQFLNTPLAVRGSIGRDVNLNCSVIKKGLYEVAWINMSQRMVLSVDGSKVYDHPRVNIRHTSTSAGIDSFILNIKDITSEDAGSYMCQLNTNEELRRIYTLSLVASPTIRDEQSSTDVYADEGDEETSVTCKADGVPKPTITWRREDFKLILIGNGIKLPVIGDQLNFTNIDRSYSGVYLCIAGNGILPSVSKRIRLNVRFAPQIVVEHTLLEAEVGGEVEFSCVVDGYPSPLIVWMEDDRVNRNGLFKENSAKEITEGDRFETAVTRINVGKHRGTLKIKNVQLRDFRGYRCFTNNSLGSAKAELSLRELVTSTTSTTSTSSTSTTSSSTSSASPPSLINSIHRLTRGHVDRISPEGEFVNKTRDGKILRSTFGPQKSFFSDQNKKKGPEGATGATVNEEGRTNNGQLVRIDAGSQVSIFANSSPAVRCGSFSWSKLSTSPLLLLVLDQTLNNVLFRI